MNVHKSNIDGVSAPLIQTINPNLPKVGGNTSSIANNVTPVVDKGEASISFALPNDVQHRLGHALSLHLSSQQGNGSFGLGGQLNLPTIQRRTNKLRPRYDDQDIFVGPSGEELVPILPSTTRDLNGTIWTVTRYRPRHDDHQLKLERWQKDGKQFWSSVNSDGMTSIFGFTAMGQCVANGVPQKIFAWYLQEQVALNGDHIYYTYRKDPYDGASTTPMLAGVWWGNHVPDNQPWCLTRSNEDILKQPWLFQLALDYGEYQDDGDGWPTLAPGTPSPPRRGDVVWHFHPGFACVIPLLCCRVILFRCKSDKRLPLQELTFEYDRSHYVSQLVAVSTRHFRQYPDQKVSQRLPPTDLQYSAFDLTQARFQQSTFGDAGLNHDQYQLVDLYGDGIPGILIREGEYHHYRRVNSVVAQAGGRQVQYEAPTPIGHIQGGQLKDVDGDGLLEYDVNTLPCQGFISRTADGGWGSFIPYQALPTELGHPDALYADVTGNGLADLLMLGPNSIRLYASTGTRGYASPTTMALPKGLASSFGDKQSLTAFADVMGSGQQHLVQVKYGELTCWPNLGHGQWGDAIRHALKMPDTIQTSSFDVQYLFLADLDGLGAVDVLYAHPQGLYVWRNRHGNGFDTPLDITWPEGLVWNALCHLSVSDLYGMGTSCVVVSQRTPTLRHWVLDPSRGTPPYLLQRINNNMGAEQELAYRSSAHEWLDERKEANSPPRNFLPFPSHLLHQLTLLDEISNLTSYQRWSYRRGFYDPEERQVNGFGFVQQTSGEPGGNRPDLLTKSWFHTGRLGDENLIDISTHDPMVGRVAGTEYLDLAGKVTTGTSEMARCLVGQLLRQESYSSTAGERSDHPAQVSAKRYSVQQIQQAADKVYQSDEREQVNWVYEDIPTDPQCAHSLTLVKDNYGFTTVSAQLQYPRRTGKTPYVDQAQTKLRVTLQITGYVHIEEENKRRLGLITEQKSIQLNNLPAKTEGALYSADELRQFWKTTSSSSLIASSRHYYTSPDTLNVPLPHGQATAEGLLCEVYSAELTMTMLDKLAETTGETRGGLESKLTTTGGYVKLPKQPTDLSTWGELLWAPSLQAHYGPLAERYRVNKHVSRLAGETRYGYDSNNLFVTTITNALGGTQRISYDLDMLRPHCLEDINGNKEEIQFNVLGQVEIRTVYGTEQGARVGFNPIERNATNKQPKVCLAAPEREIEGYASVHCYEQWSWMGHITKEQMGIAWEQLLNARLITDKGAIRARCRWLSNIEITRLCPDVNTTHYQALMTAQRTPNYSVALQAENFPKTGQPTAVRVSLHYTNGQGETIQSTQKVTPQRWVITHKALISSHGQIIKNYLPYDAVDYTYTRSTEGLVGHSVFYDAFDREIRRVNATKDETTITYHAWYVVKEDENDTAYKRLTPLH